MFNPEKGARPAAAAGVLVRAKPPALGFVPIATVMFPVNPVAVLPPASWAVTCTAGAIAAPAVVVLGCTENTSCVAVPAAMITAALGALPAPVAVAVNPGPALRRESPANGAPPPPAPWVSAPASAPAPGV